MGDHSNDSQGLNLCMCTPRRVSIEYYTPVLTVPYVRQEPSSCIAIHSPIFLGELLHQLVRIGLPKAFVTTRCASPIVPLSFGAGGTSLFFERFILFPKSYCYSSGVVNCGSNSLPRIFPKTRTTVPEITGLPVKRVRKINYILRGFTSMGSNHVAHIGKVTRTHPYATTLIDIITISFRKGPNIRPVLCYPDPIPTRRSFREALSVSPFVKYLYTII